MTPVLDDFVAALRRGEVVACATETQIGLLADALRPESVRNVCALKGRGDDAPVALLLPDTAALGLVADALPPRLLALCNAHWPGPLTVLVPAQPGLAPELVRDGRVGVRVPGPSPALTLVRAFGGPLTATSANRSGEPATTTAAEVRRVFGPVLRVVPADAPGGPPSTVVAIEGGKLHMIRAGAIGESAL